MDQAEARRATLLIMAMFFLQPLAIGGWLALIPEVKESLGLSKGELAIALVGMPAALIPSLQIAGRFIARSGPRRVFKIFFPLQAVAIALPLLAWGWPSLFVALACVGAMVGFLEVGINVYAGRLEKRSGLMIMSRCHGFWALGIFAGSAIVTLLGGVPSLVALVSIAVTSAAIGFWVAVRMPQLGEDDETGEALPRRRFNQLPVALIFVATFMFLVTLTEGSMADWAAVYLAERLGDPGARAGIAVTIFSGFMAGGRFIGDWLKARLGAVRMARVTIGAAFLGLLLLVLPLPLIFVYPGYALVGFGVSAAYPLGVSAIAALDDRYESANIAIMATVALGGFLFGPPLIGFLSEAYSLAIGLGVLLPCLVIALWLTRWLAPDSGN